MTVARERELASIVAQIARLQLGLNAAEQLWSAGIARVDPGNHASAVNLAHYWAERPAWPTASAGESGACLPWDAASHTSRRA